MSTVADMIESLMSGRAGLVVSDGVFDEGDPVLAFGSLTVAPKSKWLSSRRPVTLAVSFRRCGRRTR
jgi:hypothetical protein